jgi:integrase
MTEPTVANTISTFLASRRRLVDAGELAARTLLDYTSSADVLTQAIGADMPLARLSQEDFATIRNCIVSRYGPVRAGVEIQRVRAIVRYAVASGLMASAAVMGPDFRGPSKLTLRRARNGKASQLFTPDEVKILLNHGNRPMRAMILLGLNCGFGNNDCATLRRSAVDFDCGWVRHPRPKTEVDRRCPLWSETVDALREVVSHQKEPKLNHLDLIFVTTHGRCWSRPETTSNPISVAFRRLLIHAGVPRGRGFYALRHTFETIAGGSKDQVAVDYLMGHVRNDMASIYRERIDDSRLVTVTDLVHTWLYGESSDDHTLQTNR